MENGSMIIFFFKSIGHYPSIVSIKIVNLGRICKFSHYVPICHSYSLGNKSLIVKIDMSFFSLFDDVPYSQILQRCFLYLKTYNFLQDHNLLVNISVSVGFSSECLMEKRSNCYGCISVTFHFQFWKTVNGDQQSINSHSRGGLFLTRTSRWQDLIVA